MGTQLPSKRRLFGVLKQKREALANCQPSDLALIVLLLTLNVLPSSRRRHKKLA